MSKYKFPASLPRKMYWSNKVGGCSSCPDCNRPLEQETHTYVITTRQAGAYDAFMTGNPAGHFCGNCPVVVLDREEFNRVVSIAVNEAALLKPQETEPPQTTQPEKEKMIAGSTTGGQPFKAQPTNR